MPETREPRRQQLREDLIARLERVRGEMTNSEFAALIMAVERTAARFAEIDSGPFLSPPAVRAVMRAYLDDPDDASTHPLTDRELQVVKLVAEAHTNEQIARLLVISPRTVERHRENILAKLGMRDRVELTRWAIRHGLVEP